MQGITKPRPLLSQCDCTGSIFGGVSIATVAIHHLLGQCIHVPAHCTAYTYMVCDAGVLRQSSRSAEVVSRVNAYFVFFFRFS